MVAALGPHDARTGTEPPKSPQNAVPDSGAAQTRRKQSGAKTKSKASATKAPRTAERKAVADAVERKAVVMLQSLTPWRRLRPKNARGIRAQP